MMDTGQIQRLVMLLDPNTGCVEHELRFEDFETLRAGHPVFSGREGGRVHAVFLTVEPGLRLAGIVCFLLPLDASGKIPNAFDLPFDYLAEFAGRRAEFGLGGVRVASRAHCPVPWLSLKLWEPQAAADGPLLAVQQAVARNRLGLASRPRLQVEPELAAAGHATGGDLMVNLVSTLDAEPSAFEFAAVSAIRRSGAAALPTALPARAAQIVRPATDTPVAPGMVASLAVTEDPPRYEGWQAANAALAAAAHFANPLPELDCEPVSEPVAAVRAVEAALNGSRQARPAVAEDVPRDASGGIEQSYLEQIRKFRAEILGLKADLRFERERNRRLQELLRGQI